MDKSIRSATLTRKTAETEIKLSLTVDGTGQADINTGLGFLDHMLHALARHARFDVKVRAKGDLHVDEHHTVEDVAIVLGRALAEALGDRTGITRMGQAIVPMDEALALVAVDLGGRGYFAFEGHFDSNRVGQVSTTLIPHFFESLAHEGRLNLHARLLAGLDDHHRAEALFKALARALDMAVKRDERLDGQVPSTKGTLTV